MQGVNLLISEYDAAHRQLILPVHYELVELGLVPQVKFGIPFYYGKSWICFLKPIKPDRVELAFIRGNELSEESKALLSFNKRKQVCGIEFCNNNPLDLEMVLPILHEAIILDKTIPYKLKK
jgi:hypothetical protein